MAIKRDQTNWAQSQNLRDALKAKGLYRIDEGSAVYAENGSEQHLCHMLMDDGWLRTCATNPQAKAVWYDFIDPNAADIARIWVYREIYSLVATYPGVTFSDYTFDGTNYKHTIIANGDTYTGSAPKLSNAIAKAFTDLLNAT